MKKQGESDCSPWLWLACMGVEDTVPNPECALVAIVGLLDRGRVNEAAWHCSAVWEGWELKWYPEQRKV